MGMYGRNDRGDVDTGPGKTRQAMKDEVDINRIMARYVKTGMIAHVATKSPEYLDVSDVSDYRDAVEQVRLTNVFFMKLPAKVRARFNHDPAEFLDFVTAPGNKAEAEELGLIVPEVVPEVVPAVGGGTVVPPAVVQARAADGHSH